jgi:cell division protease FtsH
MAALFKDFFNVRKVTINSNKGGAGGYTLFTPIDRYQKYATKKFMLANLIVALGGRAAEMFLYGKKNSNSKLDNLIFKDMKDLDVTTGASNDLQQAKKIARNYVTQFGFSENVGLFDDLSNSELPFIGKELGTSNKISEKSRQDVDSEISKLIDFALSSALKLINLHQEQFLEIVDLLTKERTISGKDISKILNESNLI